MIRTYRSVLLELLNFGLVEICATTHGGGTTTAADREFINSITNLLHNVPGEIERAETDDVCPA